MSQKMRILGPKVSDPFVARKILIRPEERYNPKSNELEEMIVQENAEDFEEFNCKDVLEAEEEEEEEEEEELFHNVPDVVLQLAHERQRREMCNARLQEIERELQKFSEEFGSQLQDLRTSMKELIHGSPNFGALKGGNLLEAGECEDMDLKAHALG